MSRRNSLKNRSGQIPRNLIAINVSQTKITTAVAKGQAFVIRTQQEKGEHSDSRKTLDSGQRFQQNLASAGARIWITAPDENHAVSKDV